MMKRILLLLFALVLLPIAAGCGETQQELSGESSRESFELTEQGAPGSCVTIETLHLVGKISESVLNTVNQEIALSALEYRQQCAEEAAMLYSGDGSQQRNYERSYQLVCWDEEYICLRADSWASSANAAHDTLSVNAYVFSRADGSRVSLTQLFDGEGLELLAAAVIGSIKANGEEGYYPDYRDLVRQHLNEDNWYIEDGLIHLFFDPYVLAPETLGVQEFTYQYR